jgi:hypothetical protein
VADLADLRSKLGIDEHSLDMALREHPDLFYEVASQLALAVSNRDEAKLDLEEVEAEVDKELRRAAAINDDRTTEKEIESNKKIDKRVKIANDKLVKEKYNAAKWTALKDAYEQRSYALSKLVDLYLANYYSQNPEKSSGNAKYRDAQVDRIKRENAMKRVRV